MSICLGMGSKSLKVFERAVADFTGSCEMLCSMGSEGITPSLLWVSMAYDNKVYCTMHDYTVLCMIVLVYCRY